MFRKSIMYEVDEDGIAIISIDCPDSERNHVSRPFLKRLYLVLTGIREDRDVRGVIIVSKKTDSFLEHFEIGELQAIRNAATAIKLSQFGQHISSSLNGLHVPTIAAIHGTCRDAGLELALACHKRIGTFSASTRFSFAQIQIGVLPFMGGTQFLPSVVGFENAMDLLLTGKELSVFDAQELGLISAVVHPSELISHAKEIMKNELLQPASSFSNSVRQFLGEIDTESILSIINPAYLRRQVIDRSFINRKLVSYWSMSQFSRMARKKHHSIPAIVKSVENSFSRNRAASLTEEAENFAQVLLQRTTRNLLFLAKLREEYKSQYFIEHSELPNPKETLCFLIGAGTYGGAIAGLLAAAGFSIRLKDVNHSRLTSGLRMARAILDQKSRTGEISPQAIETMMTNISPTLTYDGLRRAHVIIETLPEKLSVKSNVFNEIKGAIRPEAIVFTTTSVLSHHQLGSTLGIPERFLGLQFLPPLDRNPLVEIITDKKVQSKSVKMGLAIMQAIGKIPFEVNNSPGYLINRILAPFLIESVLLLEEGVPAHRIEGVMVDFGMDAGPLRVLDEIGIDQALAIGQVLFFQYGDRFRLPQSLKILLADKRLGRHTSRGFYLYDADGHPTEIDPKIKTLIKPYSTVQRRLTNQLIEQRMVFLILNEAARCLAEEVVSSARQIDLAMVFGRLFPAFLGGPLRYIDSFSIQTLVREMDRMAGQFGERFEPCSLLTEFSSRNNRFYQPF